jgi:hypothetical protein
VTQELDLAVDLLGLDGLGQPAALDKHDQAVELDDDLAELDRLLGVEVQPLENTVDVDPLGLQSASE